MADKDKKNYGTADQSGQFNVIVRKITSRGEENFPFSATQHNDSIQLADEVLQLAFEDHSTEEIFSQLTLPANVLLKAVVEAFYDACIQIESMADTNSTTVHANKI